MKTEKQLKEICQDVCNVVIYPDITNFLARCILAALKEARKVSDGYQEEQAGADRVINAMLEADEK